MILSKKGQELINLYTDMADNGFKRKDGIFNDKPFAQFGARFIKEGIKRDLNLYNIKSILDYGCGGSDWMLKDFDITNGKSAKEYFGLDNCYRYEPARDIDERQKVDCVMNFDVLEHIFVADVSSVIDEIFSYATKLVVINVACYPASALLPNGENAHITVRHPHWWKAQIDQIALRYPDISILLLTSMAYLKFQTFPIYKANDWLNGTKFTTTT
tara:strand:+ start:628 stop:1272 length:645 start_codon:yes stop_codon:yes gene_type:complete